VRSLVYGSVVILNILYSKALAPVYEQLADAFQHAKDKVVIAKVDADAHRALGQRFGVSGMSL
jgi:protein disulfide-isomerase A6